MTALSFILGVLPLALSTGAGAASRVSLGVAVFGGMLVGTILGVLMVPPFYVVFQRLSEWWQPVPAAVAAGVPATIPAGDGSSMPAPMPAEDGSAVQAPEHTETPTGERR
jgi:AcrB/AcrD/AcrF family